MKLFNSKVVSLSVIVIFAVVIRFYNFPERITFWSEQARSLIVAADYLEKPSLLGQEYFRVSSFGHKIFSGALFNYSLIPLILLLDYNPIPITGYFAILNIFTGVVLFLVARKIFNHSVAILALVLFLFNSYMIYHSLFIWNYNYLPLVGVVIFYLLWKNANKESGGSTFLLGLVSGIGVSLQILFVPIALLILIIGITKSVSKFRYVFLFVVGGLLGNLPMVLFDLRHDFYHFKTILQYFLDTIKGGSDAGISYYYFLPFWPIVAIYAGKIISKLQKPFAFLVLVLYIFLNLNSKIINLIGPTGMPHGLNVNDVDIASQKIATDATERFNVASVLDFDKKAYVLRYFVGYKYGREVLADEKYQDIKLLYVLAQKDYNFESSGVWEISAGGDYKISQISEAGTGYVIYKLQK
jgi:hypothetical protein